MSKRAKILVKYASRERPSRFFDGMDSIFNNCVDPENILVVVTCDYNDPSMFNGDVKNRIESYNRVHLIYGESEGKLHACNRDLDILPDEWKDWDIIANFADDQRFTVYGWDELIRSDFAQHSPDYSHYMAYLDADTKGALSTLFIAGRKWFDIFGFIYDPVFKSLFADNLVEDCAKKLGKYHYTGYTIYQHLLPSYGHLPADKMYLDQQALGWDVDQKKYFEITSKGLDEYLKQFGL